MRKILITGSSREFSETIADLALNRGNEVYIIGKKVNKALFSRAGFHFFYIDLNDVSMMKENLKDFIKEHKFDLVILTNSSLPKIAELDQTSLNTLNDIMTREVWVNKQLIDILDFHSKVRQVVAISSQETDISQKGWGSFAIAKSALNAMIRTYASEKPWTHFSIIDIGVVMTPELKEIFQKSDPKMFPSIKRMREGAVLTPEIAGERLLLACNSAIEYKSGSFINIRNMDMIFDN